MGESLSIYDVQDHNITKIAQLDYNFNDNKKTVSSKGNHNMLIQFSSDDFSVDKGFYGLINYILINENCADWLNETTLVLQDSLITECNWIITAPTVTSTITINFQYFKVCTYLIIYKYI